MKSRINELLKIEFGKRFTRLCDDAEFIPKGRGRLKELEKHFPVRYQSINKWLSGENLPDIENAERICDLFDANIGWLMTGEGVPYRSQLTDSDDIHYTGMRARFLPILEDDNAVKFAGKYPDLELLGFWPTDLKEGDYWLTVRGNSMDDGSKSGIPEDCLILVDTKQEPTSGDYVAFTIGDDPEPLFKKFVKDGPNTLATSLNNSYPAINLNDKDFRILGKVVDAIYRPLRT